VADITLVEKLSCQCTEIREGFSPVQLARLATEPWRNLPQDLPRFDDALPDLGVQILAADAKNAGDRTGLFFSLENLHVEKLRNVRSRSHGCVVLVSD
jgi:hypothetical protein